MKYKSFQAPCFNQSLKLSKVEDLATCQALDMVAGNRFLRLTEVLVLGRKIKCKVQTSNQLKDRRFVVIG